MLGELGVGAFERASVLLLAIDVGASQVDERLLVSKIAYVEPHLLVLYGTDDNNNDCKVLANLLTVHLTLRLVRHGAPEKRRTISFVEPAKGAP